MPWHEQYQTRLKFTAYEKVANKTMQCECCYQCNIAQGDDYFSLRGARSFLTRLGKGEDLKSVFPHTLPIIIDCVCKSCFEKFCIFMNHNFLALDNETMPEEKSQFQMRWDLTGSNKYNCRCHGKRVPFAKEIIRKNHLAIFCREWVEPLFAIVGAHIAPLDEKQKNSEIRRC